MEVFISSNFEKCKQSRAISIFSHYIRAVQRQLIQLNTVSDKAQAILNIQKVPLLINSEAKEATNQQ